MTEVFNTCSMSLAQIRSIRDRTLPPLRCCCCLACYKWMVGAHQRYNTRSDERLHTILLASSGVPVVTLHENTTVLFSLEQKINVRNGISHC